jgi:hypothetical protein
MAMTEIEEITIIHTFVTRATIPLKSLNWRIVKIMAQAIPNIVAVLILFQLKGIG